MPLYETETNRRNEYRVMSALANSGHTVAPLGCRSPGDFICVMHGRTYITEYKKRAHMFGSYPTVIIPEQKLRRCLSLAEEMGISFLYIVEFDDGVYACQPHDYEVRLGGRTDRGDPNDIHKVAHINISQFREIKI